MSIQTFAKLKKGDDIPFTQISNAVLNSSNLSFSAKGLYSYMRSKPEGWNFSTKRIINDTLEGLDSVRSSLKELLIIGLIQSKKLPSGRIEYILFANIVDPKTENPIQAIDPKTENPTVGKSHCGKTRPINNTKLYKQRDLKNSLKKSITDQERKAQNSDCENSLATNQNGINKILDNLIKRKKVNN